LSGGTHSEAAVRLGRRRGQRGAALVEFALILPILVALVIGMMQYGWYFYVSQSSSSAAREVARRLVVGDCRASGEALTFARAQSNLGTMTVSWGAPSGTSGVTAYGGTPPTVGDVMRVKVQAEGKILGLFPLPNGGQITRMVDTRNEDNTVDGTC
jgi:Flp pilus assembly protein TadG